MRLVGFLSALIVLVGFCNLSSPAWGVILVNGVNSNSASAYDGMISTTDLIDVSQPTLAGPPTSTNPTYSSYAVGGLDDGTAVIPTGVAYWHTSTSTVTFQLNTTLNPLGYNLTDIRSINGYTSDAVTYANQTHSILYSKVGDETNFIPLTTLAYTPFGVTDTGAGSSLVDVTDSSGVLATGVAFLRFDIPLFVGGTNTTAVYREIDVFGFATPEPAPEPSTALLCSLALIGGQVMRRRNRRCQETFCG
jgi:hypothetical protein